MADPATTNDKSTVNLVVVFVGLTLLASIAGLVILLLTDHDGSGTITPIATGALAGLVALLANTKSVDIGGLKQLDEANQASLDQSTAAVKLHAQLAKPTSDFNALYDGQLDPPTDNEPPEQLV